MKKIKSEKASISVFVIVSFIFCMTILVSVYWSSTNYQVMALQAQQRISEIYARDLSSDRMEELHKKIIEQGTI